MALLEVENLDITYETKKRTPLQAVRNVTFSLKPGEFIGLVGESGSGKSTLGSGILRLLQPPGRITGGSVRFMDQDITTMPEEQLRKMRWSDFSSVFQSSMNALNPVMRIEAQFARRDGAQDRYEQAADPRPDCPAARDGQDRSVVHAVFPARAFRRHAPAR